MNECKPCLIGVIFAVSLISGCKPKNDLPVNLVEAEGVYTLAGSDYSLHVSSTSGILEFVLEDASGVQVLKSDLNPSTYQKWAIGWNPQNRSLWLTSSDIGTFAWFRDDSGIFVEKSISQMTAADRATAPAQFIAVMPNAIRANFEAK